MLNKKNSNELPLNPLLVKLRDKPIASDSINQYFSSFDGTRIFYRVWKPLKNLEKIIVVVHGMGGHGEFFVLLADKMVEHGIMIISPDYRNHGHSEGKKGDLKRFTSILKDLYLFIEFVKKQHPNVPIFLFGESMGGTVSINFSSAFPDQFSTLSGLILFSPGVKPVFSKKTWIFMILLAIPLCLLRVFFPSKRIISAKGREEEGIKNPIHQQYDKTDPLHLEKVSIRYLFQIFKYMRKTRKIAPRMTIPTIIFQGEQDKGVSPQGVKQFHDSLASEDKTIILIEDGYHELLTDPSFQDKWDVLIGWLEKH